MRDIAFVHKKQKLDKEGRMETIKVILYLNKGNAIVLSRVRNISI